MHAMGVAYHHRAHHFVAHHNKPRLLPPLLSKPWHVNTRHYRHGIRHAISGANNDDDAVSSVDAMLQQDDAAAADAATDAAAQFETSCGVVAPLPAERAEVDYLGESTVGDLHFVNTPKAPPSTQPRIDLGDLDKVLATPFKVNGYV